MGTLQTFHDYLTERRAVLTGVERTLVGLQERYETYFAEINRVRECELTQLTAYVVGGRNETSTKIRRALDSAHDRACETFDAEVAQLEKKHAELLDQAEELRSASKDEERRVRDKNKALDEAEEELKARNAALLGQIAEFNRRIRRMSRGFGFLSNLFRMRRLQRERRELQEEQQNVALRVDKLRERWVREERAFVDGEDARATRWIALQTEAAGLKTKLDYLQESRPRITLRSALEQVLFETTKAPTPPTEGDAKCPRCEQPNPEENHFCHVCAQRLGDDRPDFAGSFAEIGELNHHHRRFSEGMKACQEIIGLVRGLGSGLDAFMLSVADVQASESKYPLPPLQIDVPKTSLAYGQFFDGLQSSMERDYAVHPAIFAKGVEQMVKDVFTEEKIKEFFESMGEELSTQADTQW